MSNVFIHRLFLLFLLLSASMLHAISYFPYDMYPIGAKANGMGGAYVAIADDSSAVYWNPAGIIQQKKPVITYLLDTQFMINDIRDAFNSVFKVTFKTPALLGFLMPLNNQKMVAGFAAMTPIQRKIDDDFYVVQLSPVFSSLLSPNLSVGGSAGVLISELRERIGWGWNCQFGALWFITEKMRMGLSIKSPQFVNWKQEDISMVFPWDAQLGISYKAAWNLIFSADLGYVGWQNASLKENGVELNPSWTRGLFYDIIPKVGVIYIHEKSGAHLRFGANATPFLDATKIIPQYRLSFGIGGKAFKIVEVEASLVDSYLVSLFHKEQRIIEILQVNIEYKFD